MTLPIRKPEEIDIEMLAVQANIDDMNPENYTYLMDLLFDAGASDVYLTPIIMKKGRPGIILNVLVHKTRLGPIETIIFTESTTLGLRYSPTTCHRLERSFHSCDTPWGDIGVKVGYAGKEMIHFAPEYEDCAKAARESKVPLQVIYQYVRSQFE